MSKLPPPRFPQDLPGMPQLEEGGTGVLGWLAIALGAAVAVAFTIAWLLMAMA